jgi:double-stranded uracil-DNA glycosylase
VSDLRRIEPSAVPLALHRLHGLLAPSAEVTIDLDWPPALGYPMSDLLAGAGFEPIHGCGGPRVVARRCRTLADTVGAGMRLLMCGLNPSVHSADAGVGFVTASNRFWRAAVGAGLVTEERDPLAALVDHRIGMTDLVKRATPRADELSAAEYRDGFARLERLVAWLRPGAVCFVGLAGFRAARDRKAAPGWQTEPIGGQPAYVMPSTSGLNATTSLGALLEHLRTAAGPRH